MSSVRGLQLGVGTIAWPIAAVAMCLLASACDDEVGTDEGSVRESGGTYTPPDFGPMGNAPPIVTPDVIITPRSVATADASVDSAVPEPDAAEPDAPDAAVDASEPLPDAQVLAVCGDGVVNGDEACDPAAQGCCNDLCTGVLGARAECRAANGVCDVAELCDGTSVECPANVLRSNTFVCRAADATDLCDAPELCTGSSNVCPAADVRLADGAACNAGRGACWSDVCCPGTTQSTGGLCSFDEGENITFFVTSTSSTGALGTLAAADTRCNTLAAAARLAGTYHAWLSYGTAGAAPLNALDRVSRGPYLRVDGVVVSPSRALLIRSGMLSNPINRTEQNDTRNTPVWTGTNDIGAFTGNVCNNWTIGTSTPIGTVGSSALATAGWTQNAAPTCDTQAALYCIQDDCDGTAYVDFATDSNHCGACGNVCPAELTCIEGECAAYVFVTSTGTTGTIANGLAGADAICNARAARLGVPGTFVAWLSSSTVPASTRIVDAPYYRLDNLPIAASLAGLLSAGSAATPLLNPINVDEGGGIATVTQVWTGTGPLGTATLNAMCATNWTDAGRVSMGTYGTPTATGGAWTNAATIGCANTLSLYCFQVMR